MTRIERIERMHQCGVEILAELLEMNDEPRPAFYGLVLEHWQQMIRYIEYMRRSETTKLKPT